MNKIYVFQADDHRDILYLLLISFARGYKLMLQ